MNENISKYKISCRFIIEYIQPCTYPLAIYPTIETFLVECKFNVPEIIVPKVT